MTPLRLVKLPHLLLLLLVVMYIFFFGWLATQRHLAFESNALDLANYDQAMWHLTHGQGLALTTMPNLANNRMGLHVEPILYLIAPFYWLFPSPLTLIWIQTIALGLAAWPIYLLARRRLRHDWVALLIAIGYLLLPAMQAVNMFDFHAVALSVGFMLWGLYFLDVGLAQTGGLDGFWWRPKTKRALYPHAMSAAGPMSVVLHFAPAFLFFVLAMSTKEDIPLHLIMIGGYVLVFLRRWRLGLVLAGVGLLWAAVSFGVIIPANRIGGQESAYVKYFPDLGDSPLEIAFSPLLKPAIVLQLLFRPESMRAVGMLLLPFGLINLLGAPFFVLAAPSLAISLLSNNPLQQQLETWHYAAPMLPFVMLALIDGLGRLDDWLPPYKRLRITLLVTLLLVMLGYHHLRGYSVLAKPFHRPQVAAHQQYGHQLAAEIETTFALDVQSELGPHVSQRQQLTIWDGGFPGEADAIFLDVAHPRFVNKDGAQDQLIGTMVYDHDFGITTAEDGYLILQQNAPRQPFDDRFLSFVRDDTRLDAPETARFADSFALVGWETHTYREAEPQLTVYLRVLQPTTEDFAVRLYLLDATGEVKGATIFQQPALVWYPTQLWQPGEVVKIRFNTLPWWTNDGQTDQFSYALGIARQTGAADDPWQVDLRLPVTGQNVRPDKLVKIEAFRRLAGMAYVIDE